MYNSISTYQLMNSCVSPETRVTGAKQRADMEVPEEEAIPGLPLLRQCRLTTFFFWGGGFGLGVQRFGCRVDLGCKLHGLNLGCHFKAQGLSQYIISHKYTGAFPTGIECAWFRGFRVSGLW